MATATKPAIVTAAAAALTIAASIIVGFEGTRNKAYADGVGVWTICYGHTRGVKPGMTATDAQCQAWLREDLAEADGHVMRCIGRKDMPARVRAALDSLVFNVGPSPVCSGTPGRKARAGDWAGTCAAIDLYNRSGGKVVRGLVRRRAEERAVCMGQL